MTGKIGVLTGGGDCPGLNAAIRAVVRSGIASGLKVIGIRNGWQGLITNDTVPLSDHAISGIISWGGTILRVLPHRPVEKFRRYQIPQAYD